MKLIVGLGNPGLEYIKTRHNVGFMIVDNYVGSENWQKKLDSLFIKKTINDEAVVFLKPLTFMNLSGIAVRKAMKFYKIDIKDILIIQDDKDLQFGTYKIKSNSGAGGHNGINSIINELNSSEFTRLKIGINSDLNYNTRDFVLQKFLDTELYELDKLTLAFNEIIDNFIKDK